MTLNAGSTGVDRSQHHPLIAFRYGKTHRTGDKDSAGYADAVSSQEETPLPAKYARRGLHEIEISAVMSGGASLLDE
jgi:hypothetical protein